MFSRTLCNVLWVSACFEIYTIISSVENFPDVRKLRLMHSEQVAEKANKKERSIIIFIIS